jgi:hypothetical protein
MDPLTPLALLIFALVYVGAMLAAVQAEIGSEAEAQNVLLALVALGCLVVVIATEILV